MRTLQRSSSHLARAAAGIVVLGAIGLAIAALVDDGGGGTESTKPGAFGLACAIEDVTSVDVAPNYSQGSKTPRQAAEAFMASWMPKLSPEGLAKEPQVVGEKGVRFVYRRDDARLVDLTVFKGAGRWSGHYFTACKGVVENPKPQGA